MGTEEGGPPGLTALKLAAYDRVADMAPWFKEVETKILMRLVRIYNPLTQTAESSSREIADAMRIDWKTVKDSLKSLTRAGLITPGTQPPLKTVYHLTFLNITTVTSVLGGPGGISTRVPGGISTTPPLGTGGKFPPVQAPFPHMDTSRQDQDSRARVDSIRFDSIKPIDRFEGWKDSDSLLDRVLSAKPGDFDPGLIAKTRGMLQGYWEKLSRESHSRPPDSIIAAQFLTVAEWSDLEELIGRLVREQQVPGSSPAWFVTVAMQRIHGVAPVALKRRRQELRVMKDNPAGKPPPRELKQDQLFEEGRALAAAAGTGESPETKAYRERMERRKPGVRNG